MVKRSFGTLLRPLRNGAVVEGACGDARAALLIDIYACRRLFVYVATLWQPELVLCTSLTRCSPCSTADQLLGAHSTALSSISDADGRYHTVLQAS